MKLRSLAALGYLLSIAGCGEDSGAAASAGSAAAESGGSAALAGRGGSSAAGDSAGGEPSTVGAGGVFTEAGASSEGGNGSEPSPAPYAHVTAVEVSGSAGDYSFAVSIESADIDCSQYADFWEVLSETGELIYRRILEHSHTDANGTTDADAPGNTFTRTGGPVPIAADAVVLVRAHLSTGGYNGRVLRGSAGDGFTDAPDIDASFAPGVEDDDPQPGTCAF